MELQDDDLSSSSSQLDPRSFIISSISSFSERYPSASQSFRPRSEASAQQSISDLKSLLDILFTNQIPGPKLIRLEREFCTSLGHGGQGNVYGVSPDFEKKALALQNQSDDKNDQRIKHSALYWTKCVVKHLRTDQRRNDVLHAFREISRLCAPSLKSHPNIVKLVSWGISLDALEAVNLDSLSTPLLILEKARCDLAQLIKSQEYETLSYETLCHLSLDIGHGLSAVHSSGIVHGDLKLENILIFSDSQATGMKWTAKLCDFGSAVSISAAADARGSATYLGSETWLPPECYAKSLLGKPLPQSLAPCDIFVYGLVVWAVFIGVHFSPLYKIQKVDGHGADIVRHIGQQWFYARAKVSVAASFSPAYSDVHQLLAAFTDQTFSHFGGGAERQAVERRHQRRHWARSLSHARVSSDEIPEEDKVSRILSVLRASLNDSPDRRDLQPWRYLDYKRYPFVPRVKDPPRYTPDYTKGTAAREKNPTAANRSTDSRGVVLNTLHLFATYSLTNKLFSRWLEIAWATIKQNSAQIARACIRSTIQLLNQPQHRQKTYEEYLRFTIKGTPGLKDIDLSGVLEHPLGGEHYTLDSSLGEMRPWGLAGAGAQLPSGTDHDLLYSWARLRSHLKWCCWQECSVDEQSVVQRYLREQPSVDISTLAWLCRGEVGQREVQCLNGSQLPIWDFGASMFFLKSEDADFTKTRTFLLLFERGFEINSTVVMEWGECTQFRWFLQTLKQPEYALEVAAHFQRIAKEDATPPRERYYLTGRAVDVDTEEDHEALLNIHTTTTALHDAVGAANYPLVEYLIANAFNVLALDSTRRTALECMPVQLSMSDAESIRAADVNSIRALLEQNQSKPRRAKSISALPLGWEEFVYTDGRWWKDPDDVWCRASGNNALRAWQETSIEGGFDAISFIAPKTGLYQSDRLALGRIQGEKQVYRLDPLRFLKTRNDKEVARMPATKPVFDEDWYRADIRAVEEPLPLQLALYIGVFTVLSLVERLTRFPARALQFTLERHVTLVLAVFTLLSLVARLKRWPQLELIFAVVAVSLFQFEFSPLGIWMGTARVIPESSYGSNVWSNAPELFLGISAVARGETKLARSSLTGFIICNVLWVFGVTLFKLGIQNSQFSDYTNVSIMNGLCLEASALVSTLVWFDITISETEKLPLSPDKTMILSRYIAIVSLLLWAVFLGFRNYTHTHLYEVYDSTTPSNSDDHSSSDSASLSLVENLIKGSIRLVLLGVCADNVLHSLLLKPILTRSSCTYFAFSLTAKVWVQYRGVHSDIDLTRKMVDSSIGAALNSLLNVAPFLVVLGGIIGAPMNLRFSVMEITLVDVAVWTLSVVASWGPFHYFIGALLLSLYVMSALSLYLTL